MTETPELRLKRMRQRILNLSRDYTVSEWNDLTYNTRWVDEPAWVEMLSAVDGLRELAEREHEYGRIGDAP